MKVDDFLLAVGIQPDAYRDDDRIVLLRPQQFEPPGRLPAQGAHLEIGQAPEVDRLFATHKVSGSLFYHEPQQLRLTSFDAKSPFGTATTYTSLVSQFVPSGERN